MNNFTWLVNLWLSNNQEPYTFCNSVAFNVWTSSAESDYLTKSENARLNAADILKERYTNNLEDMPEILHNSMLSEAFGMVDWLDIADTFLQAIEGYESN